MAYILFVIPNPDPDGPVYISGDWTIHDPTEAKQITNYEYVNTAIANAISGSQWKNPVVAATTSTDGNIPLSTNISFTADSYTVNIGDRVFLGYQTDGGINVQNGIYKLTSLGLVRTSDANSWSLLQGAIFNILNGTQYDLHNFRITIPSTGIIDVDPVTWSDLGTGEYNFNPAYFTLTGNNVNLALNGIDFTRINQISSYTVLGNSTGSTANISTISMGNFTEATSSVLTITGGTRAILGSGLSLEVKQSTTSQDGYLSSTDWTTFNNKEPAISSGTTSQYWRGDKTFQSFATATLAVLLAGFSVGANTPLASTDSVLQAFGKTQGQLNSKQNLLTFGDVTETTSSILSFTGNIGAIIGSGLTITVAQSSTSVSGYLSSTDWTTFNNKEPAISSGLTTQYWRGDKTFQVLNTSVVPEGSNLYFLNNRVYSATFGTLTTSNTAILSGDTLTTIVNKTQGQINALISGSGLYLQIANNLSDLASVSTARSNLGLGSLALLNSINNSNWSGAALDATNGGTGLSSGIVLGTLIYGSGTNTFTTLAPNNAATIKFLTQTGTGGSSSAAPIWYTLTSSDITTALGYVPEPTITAGTTAQYWRGDKTFQTLNTSVVPEGSNLYFTNNRVYAATFGTLSTINSPILSGDSLTTIVNKVQGQIDGILAGDVSSVNGTLNRITVSPTFGDVIVDIAATYVGQSSITTLGNVGTGTWQASLVTGQYGGTGVANTGKTITIGGNFVTSGAFSTTLTVTGTTNVTLPTTGTLVNTAVTTLSSLVSIGTITTGTWNATPIAATYGGTGQNSWTLGDILYSSASNTLAKLPGNTTTAKQYLSQTGTGTISAVPAWASIAYADLPTIANNTVLGNKSGGTAIPTAQSLGSITEATSSILTITGTNNTIGNVTIQVTQSGVATSGFLSTTDWNTFNNKQNSLGTAATTTYLRGDLAWSTLSTTVVPEGSNLYYTDIRVRACVLTGFAVGANSSIVATDTVLQAFGKTQGQINAITGGLVTSIIGTAHQIIASSPTGAVTLSTPQNIDTSSSPTFLATTLGDGVTNTTMLTLNSARAWSFGAGGTGASTYLYLNPAVDGKIFKILSTNLASSVFEATPSNTGSSASLTFLKDGGNIIVGASTLTISSAGVVAGSGATWQGVVIGLTYGGTNANLTASNGGIVYSTASALAILSGVATANKMLLSGLSTTPTWSTSTIPTSAGATANKVLLSDGTNYVLSTPTFPNASATSGKIIISDGTNWIASTPTYPNAAGTSGNLLISGGTNWASTAMSGDATITSAGALTIANNAVTYAKFQQVVASSLVGNPTGVLANAQGITLGATIAFVSSALQTTAMSGDLTTPANSFVTTLATVNSNVGTFGSATQVSQITVNAKGLITAAANVTISGVSPGGTAGGDLSGTYPNPTVARINGVALGSTTATAGNLLIGSGTAWVSNATSGNVTISSTGVMTIGALQVTNSMIANSTISLTAKVTGILPVANGGSGTSTAFTTGSVVFAGASGVYTQDNAEFFWDNTNNRLGVGTASPTATGTFSNNTSAPQTAPSNSVLHLTGANASNAGLSIDAFSAISTIQLRNANTTAAAPSAVLNNDTLGQILATGYGSTGYITTSGAKISFNAEENWTDSTGSCNIEFATRASGSISSSTLRMSISSTGLVNIVGLTASRAMVTDASKNLASSAVTSTELGYLSGVTTPTGTGALVLATSPTLITPALGTPSALVGTNITGTASGLTAGNATTLANSRTIWGQSFNGSANVTGSLTAVTNITGGASSMIITSGTGNSRTMTLRTTTSGGTATTALTLAADQSATFANTVNATTFVGAFTGNASTATALQTARGIYGNNFDGTAALTQIIESTFGGTGNGFTKFSGPTTTEKTFTLPDSTCSILTTNAAVTVAQGGTGLTSLTSGYFYFANSSSTFASSILYQDSSKLAVGTTNINALINANISSTTAWSDNTDPTDANRYFSSQNTSTSGVQWQFSTLSFQVWPTGSIGTGKLVGDISYVREGAANTTSGKFVFGGYQDNGTYKDYAQISYTANYFTGYTQFGLQASGGSNAVVSIVGSNGTTPSLVLDAGTLLTVPFSGCIENDGTSLYYCNSSNVRSALLTSILSTTYQISTVQIANAYSLYLANGWKAPVICGTTANLTATYANGSSGVGATLTNSGSLVAFTVDGVSPTVGQRVLIKNQTSSLQNGIYTVTTAGSGSVAWVLTRATDYNSNFLVTLIQEGDALIIMRGSTLARTRYCMTQTAAVTVGTTSITWSTF